METLYTYTEAAAVIGLGGRSAIARRLGSLANRGNPLTVEAGELQQVGRRRLITAAGLERLQAFTPAQAGYPAHKNVAKPNNRTAKKKRGKT
jgi:hypothetical protein